MIDFNSFNSEFHELNTALEEAGAASNNALDSKIQHLAEEVLIHLSTLNLTEANAAQIASFQEEWSNFAVRFKAIQDLGSFEKLEKALEPLNRLALEYAPDALKNEKEVVLEAVQNDGLALEYASDALKNDKEVALAAVQKNGLALEYASDALKNDKEVALAAVQKDALALEYASDALKNDKEVVLAAIQNDEEALEYASKALRKDRAFNLFLIKERPYVITFMDSSLKDDPSFQEEAAPIFIPKEGSTIGEITYKIVPIPEALATKMATTSADRVGSWEHLVGTDLIEFLSSLEFASRPSSLKTYDTPEKFYQHITTLTTTLSTLEELLSSERSFQGTPEKTDPKGLASFYSTIKGYLNGLDGWCSAHPFAEKSNQEERLQIIYAAGVCGGGWLAELQQLFSLLCINKQEVDVLLASRLSAQATRSIEAVVHMLGSTNVHDINILEWQLQPYLGMIIEKDLLADPEDEFCMKMGFLRLHTVKRCVDDLCDEAKADPGLNKKLSDYTSSKPFLEWYATQNAITLDPSLGKEISSLYQDITPSDLAEAEAILNSLAEEARGNIPSILARTGPEALIRKMLHELSEDQKEALLRYRKVFQQMGALKIATGMSFQELKEKILERAPGKQIAGKAAEQALLSEADRDFTQKHKDDLGLKPSGMAEILEYVGLIKKSP